MDTIKIEKIISGYVRKNKLWLTFIDWSNYKKLLDFITDIKIHEKGNCFFVLEWFVLLDGIPFRWMELSKIYDDQYTVKFEAIGGDFEVFKGEWKIEDFEEGGIRLSYTLGYKLGIPVIEETCRDLLKEKIKKFIERIINTLCESVYNSSKNQRTLERISLNTPCLLSIDNIVSEMKIVNISKKGLLLHSASGLNTTPINREIEINFEGVSLTGHLYVEPLNSNYRIIFKEPLKDTDLEKILNSIKREINETTQILRIYDIVKSPVKKISTREEK